jgi:RNA processing factor Prp31
MNEPEPTEEQRDEAERWVKFDPTAETLTEDEKRIAAVAHAYGLAKQSEETRRWRLALENLTPGGSEFHNNLEVCVEYVKNRNRRQHKRALDIADRAISTHEEISVDINELHKKIEQLESRLFSECMAMSAQVAEFDTLRCAATELVKYIRSDNTMYRRSQPGWFCNLWPKVDALKDVIGEDFLKEWNKHNV